MNKRKYVFSILVAILCAIVIFHYFFDRNLALAGSVTFQRDYTYEAGEADSKLSCRAIALEQVKRLLLEELGTYLESETEIRNMQLKKDQIIILTAGIVSTEIIDEKWDGKTFYLKAKITVDPQNIVRTISTLQQNRSNLRELEEARKKIQEMPPMPGSRFIKESKILFQGFDHGVAAWVNFSSELKDGKIRWSIPFQGEINIAQYYLLVQNFENTPINLTPSKIRLIMKGTSAKDALPGFRVLEKHTIFGPEIIEFNGEDVSLKKQRSINLRKDDYAIIGASFEMHPDDDNAVSAIEKTEGLNLPIVFMGKSENILYIRRTSKTK